MSAASLPAPVRLQTNGRFDPLGIGTERPEFGWRLPDGGTQDAWELEVSAASGASADVVWRSGVVEGQRPFGIRYGGEPLRSRTEYRWRVRVHAADAVSPWSEASFETGLLGDDHLGARWVSAPAAGPDDRRTLYFRTTVALDAPVVKARAYVSALGWYRLFVNRDDATGQALVPRWTPFDESVEYQVYDVTGSFVVGQNVIGIAVGDGRYRGALGFDLKDARYGDRLGMLAELVLELADGTTTVIASDESWTVGRGRIRAADAAFGERVDLRISAAAWLDVEQRLEDEAAAAELPPHERTLRAEIVERLTEIGRVPSSVVVAPSGAQLIDFGQNFAGVAQLRLRGAAGTTVSIVHSEVLTPAGEVDTDYLFPIGRSPKKVLQRDEVVLGEEPELYAPWFAIRGFRYLSVEGADPLTPADVTGIVMSTDVPQIATFEASDPRLEQLWRNSLWSLRSNFLDTATDCPTRERSGWTGDLQVFGSTAVQLVDSATFLRRYLRDLAVEQFEDGTIPPYIPSEHGTWLPPNKWMKLVGTSTGWGDVAVLLPAVMHEYLGDEEVVRAQYASAKKWVDHLEWRAAHKRGWHRRFGRRFGRRERFIVDSGFHWGEWLRPGEGNTYLKSMFFPSAVVATAYFAHSAAVLSELARQLGRADDAHRYATLSAQVSEAWRAAFVRRGGARIGEDKQDDYVRALAFGLLAEEQRPAALNRLVELIEAAGDHLGTGFLSTPLLLPTLADMGRADVAHRILFQDSAPSWLAQIAQGATTIWEQWEGYDANGKAHDSHNHYAFGSVVRFLHEYVAGLSPAAPGYRTIRFAPTYPDQIRYAGVEVETPYGAAASRWERVEGGIRLDIRVPPGTTGLVRLAGEERRVPPGTHTFTTPRPSLPKPRRAW